VTKALTPRFQKSYLVLNVAVLDTEFDRCGFKSGRMDECGMDPASRVWGLSVQRDGAVSCDDGRRF
jgi:hypothetical protein